MNAEDIIAKFTQPKTPASLYERFAGAAEEFMCALRDMDPAELERENLRFDEKGRQFVEPGGWMLLKPVGMEFELDQGEIGPMLDDGTRAHRRFYLSPEDAQQKENLDNLRTEWLETFAFEISRLLYNEFGKKNFGQHFRNFWILTDEQIATIEKISDNFLKNGYPVGPVKDSPEEMSLAIEKFLHLRLWNAVRNEKRVRKKESQHEKMARKAIIEREFGRDRRQG